MRWLSEDKMCTLAVKIGWLTLGSLAGFASMFQFQLGVVRSNSEGDYYWTPVYAPDDWEDLAVCPLDLGDPSFDATARQQHWRNLLLLARNCITSPPRRNQSPHVATCLAMSAARVARSRG